MIKVHDCCYLCDYKTKACTYVDSILFRDWASRTAAANSEFSLFVSAKTVMGYRASVVKKANEIKKMTSEKTLHKYFLFIHIRTISPKYVVLKPSFGLVSQKISYWRRYCVRKAAAEEKVCLER